MVVPSDWRHSPWRKERCSSQSVCCARRCCRYSQRRTCVRRIVSIERQTQQSSLALGVHRHSEERRGLQHPVLNDPDGSALLNHEQARIPSRYGKEQWTGPAPKPRLLGFQGVCGKCRHAGNQQCSTQNEIGPGTNEPGNHLSSPIQSEKYRHQRDGWFSNAKAASINPWLPAPGDGTVAGIPESSLTTQ